MKVRDLFEILSNMMVNGDGYDDLDIEIFDEDNVLVGNLKTAELEKPDFENWKIKLTE